VHPRRACRHKRASRACSLGASARIEAVVRAGCRCWSQGGDERRRPPSRALLLSPRSTRARPGLGATAFVLVPARIALSQSHVLTCLAVARGRLLHPGDAQAEPLEAIRIRALSLLHASAYPSRPDRSSGSTIRVSDSRRAITDIASCPSLLFHGRSREVALLLPRGAVVRAAATASRARKWPVATPRIVAKRASGADRARERFPRVALTRMTKAGRSLLASWPAGSGRCPRESDSAAGAAGLKLHDYPSAGANQQSAPPGETSAGVALQSRRCWRAHDCIQRARPLVLAGIEQAPGPPLAAERSARQPSRVRRSVVPKVDVSSVVGPSGRRECPCSVGTEAAPGILSERWQLLGLRGEKSDSARRGRDWSREAPECTPRCRGGRDGCVALRLRMWWFFRDPLGGVNGWKRDRRGGEIETRGAGLRFRL